MGSASLERVKLNGSCLASHLTVDLLCQETGRSCKLLMAEGVYKFNSVRKLTDITAVCCLYPLRYSYHNRLFLLVKLCYLVHKFIYIKGNLRKEDHIRTFTVLALCKGSCAGEPACIASHDL